MCLCAAGKGFLIMKKFNVSTALKLKKTAGALCDRGELRSKLIKLNEKLDTVSRLAPGSCHEINIKYDIKSTQERLCEMDNAQDLFYKELEKLDNLIKQQEGRSDLVRSATAGRVLNFFETFELPGNKKSYYGTKIKLDLNAQNYPSAYKWTPAATMIYAEFTRSGWTVYDIKREDQNKHPKSRVTYIELPETAKAEFIKFFVERW